MRRKQPAKRDADRAAELDGKSTISPRTHGNIGQREPDHEQRSEIHPDDHNDEGTS